MARLLIPKDLLKGFEILFNLSEEKVVELSNTINKFPVGVRPEEFEKLISETISIDNKEDLAETLYSFGDLLLNSTEVSLEKIASDLVDSLNEERQIKYTAEQLKRNKQNLLTLLNNCHNLTKTYKAINLLNENDKVFKASRLITDVRFVFDDNMDGDKHAVIFHQFKINFQQGGRKKDFYVSLDNADLREIQHQIIRAIDKENIIRKNYSSLNFIEFKDE